jgi:hypothetical protein
MGNVKFQNHLFDETFQQSPNPAYAKVFSIIVAKRRNDLTRQTKNTQNQKIDFPIF